MVWLGVVDAVAGREDVDHGNRALEEGALTARLARDAGPLTVGPLSSLKLRVVDHRATDPLEAMLDAGLGPR